MTDLLNDRYVEEGGVLMARVAACHAAPSSTEYTLLRAFEIVYEMLRRIGHLYVHDYRMDHTPELSFSLGSKTWSDLGVAKKSLKLLKADIELEIGDSQLAGDRMLPEGILIVRNSKDYRRARTMRQLNLLVAIAIRAINKLRPALKGDVSKLGLIANDLFAFLGVQSSLHVEQLSSMTARLAGLRI